MESDVSKRLPGSRYVGFLVADLTFILFSFFVISGFLMSSILERQQITKSVVLDFYYRRLKRILPLYLCMILAVLAASALLMHPFEYAQLIGRFKLF